MIAVLVAIFASLLLAIGTVLQKKGLGKGSWKQVIFNKYWLLGALFAVISFLLYLYSLNIEKISVIQPIMVTNVAIILLINKLVLKEKIEHTDFAGVFIIIIGVMLIS